MSTPPPPNQPYRPQPPNFAAPGQQPPFQPLAKKPKGKGCLIAVLIVVALLVLGAIAAALNGGGSKAAVQTPATAQPANRATASAPAVTTDAVDPTTLSNNGWKITTFNMKADGAGNFGATARIVNATGADKKAAAFTLTVLDASKNIVTTLIGSAMNVAKDATVTVQLASFDPYKAGTYLYAFQVDASY
jgi:hypothetical protein